MVRSESVDGFGNLMSIRFHPTGTSIAVGTVSGNVLQWTVNGSGQLARGATVAASSVSVHTVAFNADGSLLAIGAGDGTAAVWDVRDRGQPSLLNDGLGTDRFGIEAVAFAPNRALLAVAGSNRTTVLWDLTDPKRPQRSGDPLTGHTTTVWALPPSPRPARCWPRPAASRR